MECYRVLRVIAIFDAHGVPKIFSKCALPCICSSNYKRLSDSTRVVKTVATILGKNMVPSRYQK